MLYKISQIFCQYIMADFTVPPLPRCTVFYLVIYKRRRHVRQINHNKHTIATTYVQYKKYFSMKYKDKTAFISGFGLIMQISLHKKSTNQTIKVL
jgi:hypothetical protein